MNDSMATKTLDELLGDCNLTRSFAALERIVETAERVEELRDYYEDTDHAARCRRRVQMEDALDELRAQIAAWRRWCKSNSDSTSSPGVIDTL